MDSKAQGYVAIIIFVRHPELGKVKTRLAKTIGDQKALKVYHRLLEHTLEISKPIDASKFVFYTDEIQSNDLWNESGYWKCKQSGADLGERMKNAFSYVFELNFKSVMIIGSDCYQLTSDIIKRGVELLSANDVILGPAIDGGYYLLGMNRLYTEIFEGKAWSTNVVAEQTLSDFQILGLKFSKLDTLYDVDEFEDLEASGMQMD